jgi:hypothetical protein
VSKDTGASWTAEGLWRVLGPHMDAAWMVATDLFFYPGCPGHWYRRNDTSRDPDDVADLVTVAVLRELLARVPTWTIVGVLVADSGKYLGIVQSDRTRGDTMLEACLAALAAVSAREGGR